MRRSRLTIRGTVQGVGFRPFLHRLAGRNGVTGFVVNDHQGVTCEVQGSDDRVIDFIRRVRDEAPSQARIDRFDVAALEPLDGETDFVITSSRPAAEVRLTVPADIAPCPDCLTELDDPDDRRFAYPFICCTDCGPRYTVVSALPYERERTSMAPFHLCGLCRDEFGDPADRRFHAQAICCPNCGPHLRFEHLVDAPSDVVTGVAALDAAVASLVAGRVVAVKGVGGYQLMCRADDHEVVTRLRTRKVRVDKPFALLAPSIDIAEQLVDLDPAGRAAMVDAAAPIVIAPRRPEAPVAADVAPLHSTLGVMLPSTPLHHLLAHRLHEAVGAVAVCTSGNRSDEPMVVADGLVRPELAGVADVVLSNNRRIERRADDSVGQVVAGRYRILRRARGFAPRSIKLGGDGPTVLAVGAELKNTVGLAIGDDAVLSVHIGDLEQPAALEAFEVTIADLLELVGGSVDLVVHDRHPEYLSTKFALAADLAPTLASQHHHAHLASCLVDNEHDGPAIGVTFDGLGWGTDRALWGGEFLIGDAAGFERVAHLASVPMPDGTAALREPWRMAVHHLRAAGIDVPAVGWLTAASTTSVPSGSTGLTTTSMGRLFDAIGALCGVAGGDVARHEGQAAAQLEQLAETVDLAGTAPNDPNGRAYPVEITSPDTAGPSIIEVSGLLAAVVDELHSGVGPAVVARRFHHWVADVIVATCELLGGDDQRNVALTGGVFQNRLLTELAEAQLTAAGFRVLLHRRVPANDGGIALGQLAIARALAGAKPPSTMES
ncbi:MAG: carbamoyltransferase HypF [Acidimicrobiia bacterium]|nr:carbamoyltransferase HypF [Acidimicrobiia bacterium]